jgi:deoxyribodipyrimidine photo-lyase
MAGDVTIALALEGQLRLDDQPVLHQAVALARRHRSGRLLVLACRPETQRLQGAHQRRLEAQALASLQARLAAAAVPLLHFPQHTTAAALAAIRPLVSPECLGRPSPGLASAASGAQRRSPQRLPVRRR